MKTVTAFALSFVVAASLMYLYFFAGDLLPGFAHLAALPVIAFVAGYLQGRMIGRQHYFSIGFGALLALLVVWSPLVYLTYGFALMGVPILVVLAICVGLGATLAKPAATEAHGPA